VAGGQPPSSPQQTERAPLCVPPLLLVAKLFGRKRGRPKRATNERDAKQAHLTVGTHFAAISHTAKQQLATSSSHYTLAEQLARHRSMNLFC